MMKKTVALFASLVMMLSGVAITSYADNEPDVPVEEIDIEEFLYTDMIMNVLSISNHTASCKSDVDGYYGVTTKIVITHTLQEKYGNGWYNVGSPSSSTFYNSSASYVSYVNNVSNGKYRLKTTATVYSGSDYETITIYSVEINY